jgi:hypothetical protein
MRRRSSRARPGESKAGLSTGSSFGASIQQPALPPAFGVQANRVMVADVNGDKKDDLLVLDISNNSITAKITDVPNTVQIIEPGGFGGSNGRHIVGDFNGDGLDDIGYWEPGDKSFWVAKQTSFFATQRTRWTAQYAAGENANVHVVADFDQDGKDDLGFFRSSDNGFMVALSNGSSFAPAVKFLTTTSGNANGRWWPAHSRANQ